MGRSGREPALGGGVLPSAWRGDAAAARRRTAAHAECQHLRRSLRGRHPDDVMQALSAYRDEPLDQLGIQFHAPGWTPRSSSARCAPSRARSCPRSAGEHAARAMVEVACGVVPALDHGQRRSAPLAPTGDAARSWPRASAGPRARPPGAGGVACNGPMIEKRRRAHRSRWGGSTMVLKKVLPDGRRRWHRDRE